MGEALRNTTLVSRPSDMFFLPSTSTTEGGDSSAISDGPDADQRTASDGATSVSRETTSPTDETEPRTSSAGRPEPADSTPEATPTPEPSKRSPAPPSSRAPMTADRTSGAADPEAPRSPSASELVDTSAPESVDAPDTDVSRGTEDVAEELAAVPGATFAEIPVAAIHPNRKQPRQVFDEEELAELAYSIAELGVLQPIVVRSSREDGEQSFELVMGERRWRATQRAGLSTIPAIVRETADDDLLRDALLENLHRSQLNPLEEAAAYQQLLEEFGTTQEELSRRIGRSRPQISNTIRLLRLPPLVQRRVAAGVLSSGHARALLSLADPAEMERLAQRIVAEGLSVRATEEAVQLTESGERKPQRTAVPAGRHKERLDYIADAFADRLDTSVRIALGARKGKMTIEFASVEDLNRIIEVLDPGMDRS
ncbi:ParB/RepB/Spo0J family partition protein [uncultured Kocuria sp.]|uniref:ParB/RepB/Spo0J family partition protein n=1 Tax=uncultured Kocuria sp. TaxID=259305 RepID=UPI0026204C98|nr:ParB/RepB/Spo0J family partition protein [uncultured Kocuria sp.]